ncbi:MAG: response regulator, partial [Oscillospiraceae bacterium]|nr:response regulator [Oscillospiraceae bacterium]
MAIQNHKHKILIADDSEMNRAILSDMLGDEYIILEAENGVQAIQAIQASGQEISLLLLDIVMPEMDGFGVLSEMRRNHWIEDIPVIIISSESGATQIEKAYDMGVSDFITRPFDALIVHKRVVNTILLYANQKRLVELVAEQVYETQLQNNMMIDILSHIVEFRNGETGLHIRHVHVLTELLLEKLNQKGDPFWFTQQEISTISSASALHDVGKIAIPEEVLNKPGKLTPEEFATMKTHTTIGAEMLRNLPIYQDKPLVKVAYEICRWHHERWDGRGYPDGLKGDEIPMSAQIVSLADVYDALISPRVYKGPISHEEAMQMILRGECGAFSPLLLECFAELSEDIRTAFEADNMAEDSHQRLLEVTEEMLHRENFSVSRRTLQLVEHERIKRDFFSSLNEELQFEFSMSPPQLSISSFSAEKLGFPEVIRDPLHDPRILKLMGGGEYTLNFSDMLRSTSPGSPMVSGDCLLHIG